MDPLESLSFELLRVLEADPTRDARVARVIDHYEVVGFLERRRKRIVAEVSDRIGRIPRSVSLHRSRGASRRTAIGAPSFDRALELLAPETWALAVFKQSTRSLVQVMIERWGAVVESGRIKLHHAGAGPVPGSEVLRTLRAAMDLAKSLSMEPERIPEALAKNAAEDPEPAVRERALLALASAHAEAARDACMRALGDPEPAVRLAAALSLEESAEVEAVLAELATSWGVDPELRLEAFERYLEVAGDAMPVLERALADPILAERAVAATVRFSDPSWIDFLAEVYADCDQRLKLAIALVLADVGHPKAELLLLGVPMVPPVIARLAEIGSARAIPVLRSSATRDARAAIARILERVGPLDGHVALVDAEDRAGALSEADAGGLSLASPSSSEPSSSTSRLGSKREPKKPT